MPSPQSFFEALESRRLLAAGALDTSFRGDGLFTDNQMTAINDMAVQSDGRIVAVGYRNDALGANSQMVITRFNADGSLDTSFGVGGRVTPDFTRSSIARAVTIDSNANIIVAGSVRGTGGAGSGSNVAVVRLNSDGALDNSFSDDGMAITNVGSSASSDVAVDVGVDGKNRIVIGANHGAAQNGGWTLLRYRNDGRLDGNFGNDGIVSENGGTLNAIDVLKNGRVLAAGELDDSSTSSATIIRYTGAGARDPLFGIGGVATSSFQGSGADQVAFTDIDVQGKRILAVGLSQTQSRADVILARFTTSGIRDNTFAPPSSLLPDDRTVLRDSRPRLALQSDNAIVIGLTSSNLAGREQNFTVARLLERGSFDNTFDADGATNILFDDQLSTLHALALQPQEGRIILGGRTYDVAPGNPESASAAVAALQGFKAETGPDRENPRAILQTQHPQTRGTDTQFIVRYIDNRAINLDTIDHHDIVVTGPNGFHKTAKVVQMSGKAGDVRVLYSVGAPGGAWNRADNGRYAITLQEHQVADEAGNFAAQKVLGRFRVNFA